MRGGGQISEKTMKNCTGNGEDFETGVELKTVKGS